MFHQTLLAMRQSVTLLLMMTALFIHSLAFAQGQLDTYKKAVDNINCAAAKKMLTSFERGFLAKNINTCSYEVIVREVKKIQENQTKGYKQEILNIVATINGYKNGIDNPSEYLVFENALDELAAYANEDYGKLCNKYAKPTNSVCRDFEKSNAQLTREIAGIVNKALLEIGKNTYGGDKAKERIPVDEPKTTAATGGESDNETPAVKETETIKDEPATTTGNSSGSSLAAIVSTIVLVLLIAAVGWLYKEQQELKEQLEDIRMMLRVFNQKKTD